MQNEIFNSTEMLTDLHRLGPYVLAAVFVVMLIARL